MSAQQKILIIIEKLKYNDRQLGEILGISTQSVYKKRKNENGNFFNDKDLFKIKQFLTEILSEI